MGQVVHLAVTKNKRPHLAPGWFTESYNLSPICPAIEARLEFFLKKDPGQAGMTETRLLSKHPLR
jgi:hypothetical protein